MLAHAPIMYKSGRASSYCFGSSWHLLDLTDVLLLEDVVLSSCSDWLLLAASLLWADSLPHCTGPTCRNVTNIDARLPRLHWFSPNFSSQYLCSQASYQKLVKAKSDHHHCPISVFLLLTSIRRASQRSSVWAKNCPKWGRGGGGGGGSLPYLLLLSWQPWPQAREACRRGWLAHTW